MLGMGALLAYSLLQKVDLGQDNQLSRIGQNLAARTGLDLFGERMSSVHTEGIWLVGTNILLQLKGEWGEVLRGSGVFVL